MNKKIMAIAIAFIMMIGMLPNLIPTATAGAGLKPGTVGCTPVGIAPFCLFLHPGVADPYKPGYSQTLDTIWGTQAGPPNNGAATAANNAQTHEFFEHYLDYAILASSSDSIGDFQLDLVVLAPINDLRIYVPGETPGGNGDGFRWLAPSVQESIWTDITNDYEFITTSHRSAYDAISPYSMRVDIGFDDWSAHSLTIMPGVYHIRFFDIAAPKVAGLYHFKVYFFSPTVPNGASIGAGNYPLVVVKSELNPAWIAVTVRAHLQFPPALISGSVLAEGTTPEGRSVWAQGWWGPNEFAGFDGIPGENGNLYRVWLFGVAAGTYTLTAQGTGYGPTTSDRMTVDPGQSYSAFLVIFDSPDFHLTVWSKHGTGAIPWGNLWQLPYGTNDPYAPIANLGPRRDIMIELYDPNQNLVGWWASNALRVYGDAKTLFRSNVLGGYHDDFVVPPVAFGLGNGGTIPSSDHYNAWLTDNWDLLGNPRGIASHNPATRLDPHVPWDTADYIAGLPNGQYTVNAFVTGYIMDETDAYQRTFTASGIAIGLQMDLRRSNWIEVSMHLPSVLLSTADTTVTLQAVDSGTPPNVRGSAGLSVSWAIQMGVPAASQQMIDAWWVGLMPNAIPHAGGIVIEGWNAVFPNAGGGRGAFRDPQTHDYGLNPTKPSVDILVDTATPLLTAGNPYTMHLYMSDMGFPYLTGVGTPGSTPLVGSPRGTGWYNIVGDPVISIFLCNSAQVLSFSIVNAWLWIGMRSVDQEVPSHSRPWTFPGAEVGVEFIDSAGNSVAYLDPTIYGLFQDPGRTTAGWVIPAAPAGSFGVTPFDIDSVHAAGMHEALGVTFYGTDFCSTTIGGGWGWPFGLINGWLSTSLAPGEYTYDVHTHGYVMRRSFPVQVPASNGADISADLIQGGQIRVVVDFLHEGLATAFSGFIRVEVFDPNGKLVGGSIYGQANPNFNLISSSGYQQFDPITDHELVGGPAQATDLGLPSLIFPSSDPAFSNGQRANWMNVFYGIPAATWATWSAMAPSDANRFIIPAGGAQSIDVYGFYWYYGDVVRTWAGGWPTTTADGTSWTDSQWDSGIRGTVDIPGWSGSGGGLYSVKVWAFDPRGPDNAYEAVGPTDDWRMYYMAWPLENVEVPWGGSTSLFLHMNNMATLRGTVEWMDMFGNVRPLAWAQVSATDPDTVAYTVGNGAIGAGAADPSGSYIMWLPAGSHDLLVGTSEAPGVWSSAAPTLNQAFTVVLSDGWIGTPLTRLNPSGTPVPELPPVMAPLALFAVLAASVWLLRKRNLTTPVLMK
jgi:hypothetical protein